MATMVSYLCSSSHSSNVSNVAVLHSIWMMSKLQFKNQENGLVRGYQPKALTREGQRKSCKVRLSYRYSFALQYHWPRIDNTPR